MYTVDSKKNLLSNQFASFFRKNNQFTHLKRKKIRIGLKIYSILERMNFSLVDLLVSVLLSMSVRSEKKKEETKNINIYSNAHTQIRFFLEVQ